MSGAPSFEFVDAVTSDLSFAARGATLEDVFAAAAEALLAATVESPEAVEPREERSLALEEPDLELLLLRFLNELVYLRDAQGLLLRPRELRVSCDGTARLSARLAGEPVCPERHRPAGEVKAATAHGLRVARSGEGWQATVTLDV
jgi:SHS2 domain-containing protein